MLDEWLWLRSNLSYTPIQYTASICYIKHGEVGDLSNFELEFMCPNGDCISNFFNIRKVGWSRKYWNGEVGDLSNQRQGPTQDCFCVANMSVRMYNRLAPVQLPPDPAVGNVLKRPTRLEVNNLSSSQANTRKHPKTRSSSCNILKYLGIKLCMFIFLVVYFWDDDLKWMLNGFGPCLSCHQNNETLPDWDVFSRRNKGKKRFRTKLSLQLYLEAVDSRCTLIKTALDPNLSWLHRTNLSHLNHLQVDYVFFAMLRDSWKLKNKLSGGFNSLWLIPKPCVKWIFVNVILQKY